MEQSDILGLKISWLSYADLLRRIEDDISASRKLLITYANQHVLNQYKSTESTRPMYEGFDIVHPDGTGIRLAQRFLYNRLPLRERINGTDFYALLPEFAKSRGYKIFFFGNTEDTVRKIQSNTSSLIFAGAQNGFKYHSDDVVTKINESRADIVLVGLGAPLQEQWISENVCRIHAPVIIGVGEGLKVFSGTKIRGPRWLRAFGLEWAARLLSEPRRLSGRYLLGIPLFFFYILQQKVSLR